MANPILRQKLGSGEFLVIPGVQAVGFDTSYGGLLKVHHTVKGFEQVWDFEPR